MPTIQLPYGTGTLPCTVAEERLLGVLTSKLHDYKAPLSEQALVEQALAHPA